MQTQRTHVVVIIMVAVLAVILVISNGPAQATSTLRNLATSFCLDSNTTQDVSTLECNAGSFQEWVFLRL